jgi:ABC-2 type transport system ATP-binding protein
MNSAIEIEDLRVVRGGREVLPGLTLSIPAGRVVGLLGPSGSGKSTLLRAIVGTQRVAGGSVTVLGHPAGSPAVRRRLGYMTQAASVYSDLTPLENVRFFAAVAGVDAARADEALRTVGLEDVDRPAAALSGGQRARVSLAAALVADPDVLVLDEPTVGLDPLLRRGLWRTFRELAAAGRTLLVSSHVMDEANQCDSLLLMRDGRILVNEPPAALLRRTGAPDVEHAFVDVIEAAA